MHGMWYLGMYPLGWHTEPPEITTPKEGCADGKTIQESQQALLKTRVLEPVQNKTTCATASNHNSGGGHISVVNFVIYIVISHQFWQVLGNCVKKNHEN